MTLWQSGGLAFGYVVYSLAWLRGGRPERSGAAVMLLGNLLVSRADTWEVDGFYPGIMGVDLANLLIFGWLCLRSERWWPLVVAAGSALIVLAYVIRLLDPALSHYALASAKVGLAYVVDLALLLGVWERWLAGEPAAGPAAWARTLRPPPPGRPGRRGAERAAEQAFITETDDGPGGAELYPLLPPIGKGRPSRAASVSTPGGAATRWVRSRRPRR